MAIEMPPVPDGSAIITPNQQYAELQAVRASVDRLAATLDPALLDIRKDIDDNSKDIATEAAERKAEVEKLRAQIDTNTQWRNRIIGALLLLSALVGWGAVNFARLIGG